MLGMQWVERQENSANEEAEAGVVACCNWKNKTEAQGHDRRQGFQDRKFWYRRRPWVALFSGWNWVAKILSLAIAAENSPP